MFDLEALARVDARLADLAPRGAPRQARPADLNPHEIVRSMAPRAEAPRPAAAGCPHLAGLAGGRA